MKSLYWINNVNEMQTFKEKLPNINASIEDLKNLYDTNKENYIKDSLKVFDNLFSHKHTILLEETPEILLRAQKRNLYKERPFHYNKPQKDSFADAVLIESLFEYTRTLSIEDNVFFISRNTEDFSDNERKDKLHSELMKNILDV